MWLLTYATDIRCKIKKSNYKYVDLPNTQSKFIPRSTVMGKDERSLILCASDGDIRVLPVAWMEKNQSKLWAVNNPILRVTQRFCKHWYCAVCSKEKFTSTLPVTALEIKGNIRFTSTVATPAFFLVVYFCSCSHNTCLQCFICKLMASQGCEIYIL